MPEIIPRAKRVVIFQLQLERSECYKCSYHWSEVSVVTVGPLLGVKLLYYYPHRSKGGAIYWHIGVLVF